jgi:hypothetical protein
VGGHGPIYSIDEYKNYKQTLEKTIDAIKKFKLDGLTPEQMKEQKVLKNWESYGSFFITAERCIDTLYPCYIKKIHTSADFFYIARGNITS